MLMTRPSEVVSALLVCPCNSGESAVIWTVLGHHGTEWSWNAKASCSLFLFLKKLPLTLWVDVNFSGIAKLNCLLV